MPRVCTVCAHPDRADIDRALTAGESNRRIAAQYDLSETSVRRHRADHITAALADAVEAERIDQAVDVMAELTRYLARANKLLDACDDWLTDPEQPDRYSLDARANEVNVIYWDEDPNGRKSRRKAKLSFLLDKIERQGHEIDHVESKHADPRELILKTLGRLQGHVELLAELQGELDRRAQLNVTLSPDWQRVRSELVDALAPFPDARVAVAERLVMIEASSGR